MKNNKKGSFRNRIKGFYMEPGKFYAKTGSRKAKKKILPNQRIKETRIRICGISKNTRTISPKNEILNSIFFCCVFSMGHISMVHRNLFRKW